MIYDPHRVLYNEKLAKEWLEKHGIVSTVPKASDQIKSFTINGLALCRFGYNPSIAMHDGKMIMAYRYHVPSGTSRLALAELDAQFNVTSNKDIQINAPNFEDSRLFHYHKELWISWVEPHYPQRMISVVKYGRLDGLTVKEQWQVQYGNNNGLGCEKNWVFFESEGKLFAIYDTKEKQTVIEVVEDRVVGVHESSAIYWAYGTVRGGSVPLPYAPFAVNANPFLLRFFHSSLDNEMPPDQRRYYVGAMLMEPIAPFKPFIITKRPLLRGSEIDNLSPEDRSQCPHYKKQVVFPCGAIPISEGYCVSVGINDSACMIALVPHDHLKRLLI